MALVYIPTSLSGLTGGRSPVEVEGETVRQVIDNLERAWPGIRERLVAENRLRPNISVAVDGEVTPLGLLEPVGPASEIHFVAAISGGAMTRRLLGLVLMACVAIPAPAQHRAAWMREARWGAS